MRKSSGLFVRTGFIYLQLAFCCGERRRRLRRLFNGRKTGLFWKGLIIFGLSITALFYTLWSPLYAYLVSSRSLGLYWLNGVPPMFGGVVFMFIGLYMMKSGVVEEESAS